MELVEREVGQLPVSIGTSLAIEGVLGIHPKQVKQPIDVKTIKEIWINLRTLARNFYQAIPTDKISILNPNEAVDIIYNELDVIQTVLDQYKTRIKVRYYIASSDAVKWMFPKALFKIAKTPKQMAYEVYERYVAIELVQRLKQDNKDYIEIDTKPPKTDGTIVLLTHLPHELLWKEYFTRLILLESHTGRLKPYNQWYTKLNGIGEEIPLPFTKFTIQIFGESNIIEPQSKMIKGQIKQMAKSRKWTPVTTQDKIYHDIMTHGSKELKEIYKLLR